MQKTEQSFSKLIDIVEALRAPDGCPWDREQTLQTLTPHIIEEAYELIDAIKTEDNQDIIEECGDVLLHIVMIATIAKETNAFELSTIIDHVSEKMIRRHPHVFGDKTAENVEDVWKNWDEIKAEEKSGKKDGLFSSIPSALPALLKAQKIQKKVARQGFDWPDENGPYEKVVEELEEVRSAKASQTQDQVYEECGDLLFAAVNLVRKYGVNPEEALQDANQKFMKRYEKAQNLAKNEGETFEKLPLEQQDIWWEKAKHHDMIGDL